MANRAEWDRLLTAAYDNRSTSNLDGILACFHPDANFRIVGSEPEVAAITGAVAGREKLRAKLDYLVANWDLSGMRNIRVVIEDGTVVVQRRGKIRFIPNGTVFETDILDIIVMRDGMITEFTEFVDTLVLARVSGAIA